MAAKDAIDSIGRELVKQGVKFTFGSCATRFYSESTQWNLTELNSSGSFRKAILDDDGCTVIGVEAVDGTRHYADKVIVAAGAYTPALIDLEEQCVAKVSSRTSILFAFFCLCAWQAWVYGHIKLSPEEAAEYKSIPTVYNGDYVSIHEIPFKLRLRRASLLGFLF